MDVGGTRGELRRGFALVGPHDDAGLPRERHGTALFGERGGPFARSTRRSETPAGPSAAKTALTGEAERSAANQADLDIVMSSRILWTLQWRSAGGDRFREWICTPRSLRRILIAAVLAWTGVGVVGATWSGHQARMARLTLEAELQENRILRDRQAALFGRVFELVTRIDSEGARLGINEGPSMLTEAEQACLAAQYALESTPAELPAAGPQSHTDLDCDRLARGIRQRSASELRAAM